MKVWNISKLGDVAKFTNGGAWNQSEYVESGIPVVRVSDISNGTINLTKCKYLPQESLDKYKKHLLFKGDLIIATVGSHPTQPGSVVGKAASVPASAQGALLNQNVVRIAPANDLLDKGYLRYLGTSQLFRNYIISCARGSANQVRMSIGAFKEMEISLPPLPTQRKIATILSAYDDLIENNTRRIQILEEMAQNLYREWFVHFRFPGHEKVRMVDSELGPIPEGWKVVKLGDIIELAYGKGLRKSDRIEGSFPVYGSSGVVDYHKDYLVKGPGIIVGRKGNVGSVFWSGDDFYPIDTVYYVKTDVSLYYVYYNLKHQNFINNDAAVPGLSRNQAYLLPFLFPHGTVTEMFQKFVSDIFKQIELLNDKNVNLCHTRDLLIPKLISGKISINGIEDEVL